MKQKPPPKTTEELLERCQTLSGRSLAELAKNAPFRIPQDLRQAKGWVGQLIEWHLGAPSKHLPQPDFLNLGIELKTLPLNAKGLPQESTYVCTAPHSKEALRETWSNSRVRHKLASVLWVPVQADPNISLSQRCIGSPFLWKMTPEMESILKEDWEELMDMISLGQFDRISARFGTYLHIRPKAANSRILSAGLNSEGEPVMINPKGFYLRTTFTQHLLNHNFL